MERLEPPQELNAAERELWERVVFSRRPQWFAGSESLLQSYVTLTVHCQEIEKQLRMTKPRADGSYERLARLHRQTVTQCTSLARSLRLTVQSRLDKTIRADGDEPLAGVPAPWHRTPQLRAVPDAADSSGERRFSDLLRAEDRGVEVVTRALTGEVTIPPMTAAASLAASEAVDTRVCESAGSESEPAKNPNIANAQLLPPDVTVSESETVENPNYAHGRSLHQ
jgi:hypothetical protein